jgi:hypothetical protein
MKSGMELSNLNPPDGSRDLVHRLDLGTSSCLVVAKSESMHARLMTMLLLTFVRRMTPHRFLTLAWWILTLTVDPPCRPIKSLKGSGRLPPNSKLSLPKVESTRSVFTVPSGRICPSFWILDMVERRFCIPSDFVSRQIIVSQGLSSSEHVLCPCSKPIYT